MKSAVPKVSQTARLLLHSTDGVTGCSTSSRTVSNALKATAQYATISSTQPTAAAAAGGGDKPSGPGNASTASPTAAAAGSGDKAPNPLTATTQLKSPPPSAAAAAAAKQQPPAAAAASAPKPGPPTAAPPKSPTAAPAGDAAKVPPGSGSSSSSGGKKSGWLGTAALIAIPAGAYYYYEHQKSQYNKVLDPSVDHSRQNQIMPDLGSIINRGKDFVTDIKRNIPDITQIGNAVTTAGKKVTDLTHRNDKLQHQKQRDEESGFKMLPPEGSSAAAPAAAGSSDLAAADDTAAAAAAARDSMSAAADEFPVLTAAAAAGAAPLAAATTEPDPKIEHVDTTPINALFAEVSNIDYTGPPSTTTTTSSSSITFKTPAAAAAPKLATAEDASRISSSLAAVAAAQQQVQQQQPQQQQRSQAPAAAAAAEYHSDSEIDQLCSKLGLNRDLSPAGLIAAANAAGLGAYSSSSGTPVPAQIAQLNQASADARLLGDLLNELAAKRDELQQQLQTAAQEKQWAEESAEKREASLTEHFKELLREQSRIHAATTSQAVKEAEEVLLADLTAAQLQERKQRLAVVDELRAKVNALSLAFEQRTSQIRSAGDVNKISIGVLALSKALEEGTPVAQQLQDLAIGCPDDPVVAAVASSLPAAAATTGLPTLQQLQQEFATVATAAAEAAYFTTEGEGGVLARAAAKLAVRLKVNTGITDGEGPDKFIQQARVLLQQGRLLAAADALSAAASGSQAAVVVQQWVAGARARAVADQAVKLLQAHATTTALGAKV